MVFEFCATSHDVFDICYVVKRIQFKQARVSGGEDRH